MELGGWGGADKVCEKKSGSLTLISACSPHVARYCPGFKDSVVGVDVLTPPDLERIFGLTGGHICHGAMGLDGLYFSRPFRGWARWHGLGKGRGFASGFVLFHGYFLHRSHTFDATVDTAASLFIFRRTGTGHQLTTCFSAAPDATPGVGLWVPAARTAPTLCWKISPHRWRLGARPAGCSRVVGCWWLANGASVVSAIWPEEK